MRFLKHLRRFTTPTFNPAVPEDHALIEAEPLRDQFNALKALIDANVTVTNAQVDGVVTVQPVDPANVLTQVNGGVLHLTFYIPRGYDGSPGSQGGEGPQGPQGPPFATVIIDSVTTLNPGEAAWVTAGFDGTNVHLSMGIPRGNDGAAGAAGAPGEVTNAALASAIAGTSSNTNGVTTLETPFTDPDADALRVKLNELITAARR